MYRVDINMYQQIFSDAIRDLHLKKKFSSVSDVILNDELLLRL